MHGAVCCLMSLSLLLLLFLLSLPFFCTPIPHIPSTVNCGENQTKPVLTRCKKGLASALSIYILIYIRKKEIQER